MFVVKFFRVATLVLMALALLAVLLRPEVLGGLVRSLFWLVPAWIGLLYVVQSLATPDMAGTTTLEVWGNRLRRRRWTCPQCDREHRLDVLMCDDCGGFRPSP